LSDPALAKPHPSRFTRGLQWGLGGLLALAIVTSLFDTDAGTPASSDPAAPDPEKVAALRDVMKPVTRANAIFVLALPAGAGAAAVEAAAKEQCAQRSFCQVLGWVDGAQLPGAWPMLDRELAALSFRYALNRESDYEETTWFCGSPGAQAGCTRPVEE